ncbi:MAG: DUF4493 domain-containing protein [Bacteroidaceae bacterium]|nr:DUF4493 domain-containing protein [Bacteroidaceae bacterium]
MKLHKIFLGCAAALALVSCVSEDLSKVGGKDAGRLEIGVETQEPLKTRAGEYTVTNFPVTIYEADGTTKVQSFETVSAMPAQILLPVGNYVLEAHTPGVMERIMNAPYYKGSEPSEILKDATTQSTITCRMANTSVTVHYDQDFLDLFTSWTITFDDGTDNALSFTNDDGDTPAALYWDLGDGVEKLTVNFRGVNKDGTITAKNALTKSQATETYDGQNTNFAGGDAVVVNFTPVEATTGYVTVGITSTIFGQNAEEVPAVVEIVDNGTFTPDDGGNDPQPGVDPQPGDDKAITLNMPNDMTITAETDPALGDAVILTPKGIKSLKVTIVSSNPDMVSSLTEVADNYPGVDFINGAEVVGNTNLVSFLGELGQEITVPTTGQTEYTFPIGNFFGFLLILEGEHTFNMTVEDQEGNIKQGTLKLTI